MKNNIKCSIVSAIPKAGLEISKEGIGQCCAVEAEYFKIE